MILRWFKLLSYIKQRNRQTLAAPNTDSSPGLWAVDQRNHQVNDRIGTALEFIAAESIPDWPRHMRMVASRRFSPLCLRCDKCPWYWKRLIYESWGWTMRSKRRSHKNDNAHSKGIVRVSKKQRREQIRSADPARTPGWPDGGLWWQRVLLFNHHNIICWNMWELDSSEERCRLRSWY